MSSNLISADERIKAILPNEYYQTVKKAINNEEVTIEKALDILDGMKLVAVGKFTLTKPQVVILFACSFAVAGFTRAASLSNILLRGSTTLTFACIANAVLHDKSEVYYQEVLKIEDCQKKLEPFYEDFCDNIKRRCNSKELSKNVAIKILKEKQRTIEVLRSLNDPRKIVVLAGVLLTITALSPMKQKTYFISQLFILYVGSLFIFESLSSRGILYKLNQMGEISSRKIAQTLEQLDNK